MKEEIKQRVELLREEMKKAGIDAAIIPHVDPHQSEYIAPHWQVRRWLSGFTGSAGDLVVALDGAYLWTDSRYFLQAATQLEGTPFNLMKDGLPDTPTIVQFLCDNLPAGSTVGVDGMLFTAQAVKSLRAMLQKHALHLVTDFTPIDKIWTDRPALPLDKVIVHDTAYAGRTAKEKINDTLKKVAAEGADSILISDLAEIAWLLNIRSRDVNCNPVATAFLYLAPAGSTIFIDNAKLDDIVREHLSKAGVAIADYKQILPFVGSLRDVTVMLDENRTADRIVNALTTPRVSAPSPVAIAKACKNDVQIEGVRQAMLRDGVAMVKSLMEIEKTLADGEKLTEMGVADILLRHRSAGKNFYDISFETIAGYGPHGAIVHYEADPESNSTIEPHGLLLIDSGAQYLDGTTDITRTICLGTPTRQEKTDFTLVMKGHIALGSAIFPEGTRGGQLDALARQFLWKHGLSYLHGTGHGVGHFLNVHEGPQSIRLNDVPTPLMPGMITSNEPGLYRENIHGIRCENLVLTVPAFETEFGRFYRFETLTLCPFDRQLFDTSIMSDEEIRWVNNYQQRVNESLSPLLSAEEKLWLENATRPL